MLKKQISGLRWEYHLERYIGTLIPGSNCAGINCFRWRGFLSLNILYTPNWILNSPKLRRKRRNAVLSYSGQMLLHIPDFPCGYQYMYSFRNKINLVHSSTYNFCKKYALYIGADVILLWITSPLSALAQVFLDPQQNFIHSSKTKLQMKVYVMNVIVICPI